MALVAMMSVTTAAIKVTGGKYVPFGMGIILLATKRHCHFKAQLYHTLKKASEIYFFFKTASFDWFIPFKNKSLNSFI